MLLPSTLILTFMFVANLSIGQHISSTSSYSPNSYSHYDKFEEDLGDSKDPCKASKSIFLVIKTWLKLQQINKTVNLNIWIIKFMF